MYQKLWGIITILTAISFIAVPAHAQVAYDNHKKICNALMVKIEQNLAEVTDKDRIKDSKYLSQANMWALSYNQYNCDKELYLNALRRYIN